MRMFKSLLVAMLSFAAVMSGASLASADAVYWQQMAKSLNGRHVYQDPSVQVLTPQQVQAFDDLIAQSAKPIYVVVVNQDQAGKDTNAYPMLMHEAFGQSGAYAVVGPKTFKASAFDVPNRNISSGVTQAASDSFAAAKARGAKGADAQLVKDWVEKVAQMDWTMENGQPAPPAPTPMSDGNPSATASDSGGMSGWLIALLVALGLGGVASAVYYFVSRKGRKDDMASSYTPGAYRSSQDYPTTSSYDSTPTYQQPPTYSSPTSVSDDEPAHKVPRSTKHKTKKHNHYFGGGYTSSGQYYPPGYYSSADPFWTYLMWSELLHHSQSDYDAGYRDGQQAADRDDSSSSGGGWSSSLHDSESSGYSSGSSGGGDFDLSSDDNDKSSSSSSGYSWSTPTYSSGSSGGGDFGSSSASSGFSFGGFDSGSSSSSSGGGFDSGSSGGGDF